MSDDRTIIDSEFDEDDSLLYWAESILANRWLSTGESVSPEQVFAWQSTRKFKPGDREAYLKEMESISAVAINRARENRKKRENERIARWEHKEKMWQQMLKEAREKKDWSLTPNGKLHAEYWLDRGKCFACFKDVRQKGECTAIWCPLAGE